MATYGGAVTALLQLIPVFAGVAAGHLLVRTGAATREQGRFVFVFAFYVCAPALVFQAFAETELTRDLITLPLAAFLAVVGGYGAGVAVSRRLDLPPPRLAVFLMACMIVNTAFVLPFVEVTFGHAGVARLMAFDAVNAALIFSWGYAIAVNANPEPQRRGGTWRKLAASPPLYGVAAGLAVNVTGVEVADVVAQLVDAFARPTAFLVTIGIGMLLVIERSELRVGLWAVATRLCTGLAVAVIIVTVFGLTGVERAVLLTLAVAPVGFNTITFASLENLDLRLATGTASLSLAVSLVLVPLVLLFVA